MEWREPLKFIAVGLVSLCINFAVFRVLYVWLVATFSLTSGDGLQLTPALAAALATACGYSAGVANGFVLNRAWTFKAPATPGQLPRFAALNVFSLVSGRQVSAQFVDRIGLAIGIASILVTAGTTVVNFLGSKYWAFAPPPSSLTR